MLARDMLSEVIPCLKTSDSGLEALNWMDIFKVSHLPIVNNKEFLGLISEDDIYDLNMADEPVGNHSLSLRKPYVMYDKHLFEVLEIAARLKLSVIPVLDEKKNYLGLILLNDLLYYFAEISAILNPGGIIVLEMLQIDYQLAEIAQIIEGNNAKILSVYMRSLEDSVKIEVIIKVNVTDLTSINQTFYRYNYNVKASFMYNDDMEDFMNDRFDSFLKFLNI